MGRSGTYVYCLVAGRRRPSWRRRARGLSGMGPVRLLEVDPGRWLVVSDAPLGQYGEQAINRRLSDLAWVSRAALAHEAVVEMFIEQPAVLPMKLFTIFASDARALEHVREDRRRVDALVKRVTNQLEWGIRVTVRPASARRGTADRTRRERAGPRVAAAKAPSRSGADYLLRKRARYDQAAVFARRAREAVVDLYDRLSRPARVARRRAPGELPIRGGPLLLDAAFLVPRSRAMRFRALAAREAKRLDGLGLQMTLTGPWPPYTFVRD